MKESGNIIEHKEPLMWSSKVLEDYTHARNLQAVVASPQPKTSKDPPL